MTDGLKPAAPQEGAPETLIVMEVAAMLQKFDGHVIQCHATHPNAVTYTRKDLSDAHIAELQAKYDALLGFQANEFESELATTRNEALEKASQVGYWICAGTRHVTLGDKVADEIRALKTPEQL